jgi:predicted ester cyclase
MSASQPVSTLDRNKQLVQRWFDEVWNQSRRETIFDLFSTECVLYEGHTPIRGPQEFADFHDRIRAQFNDIHIDQGVTLAENDLVSLRWTVSGVHKATGKNAKVSGISIVRIKDGRFVEAWQNWDAASMAAQLSDSPPAPLF